MEPAHITRPICVALILALSGCGGIWKSNAGGLPLYKVSVVPTSPLDYVYAQMSNSHLAVWPGYQINGGGFTPMNLPALPQIDPVVRNFSPTLDAVNESGLFVGHVVPRFGSLPSPTKTGRACLLSSSSAVLLPLPPGQPEIFDEVDGFPMTPFPWGITEDGYAIIQYPTNSAHADDPNVGAIWLQSATSSQLLWRRGEFPGGPGTFAIGRDGHIVYATNAEGIFVWHNGSSELAIPISDRPPNSFVLAVNGNGDILGYTESLPGDPPRIDFWTWRKSTGLVVAKGLALAEIDLWGRKIFSDGAQAIVRARKQGDTDFQLVIIAENTVLPLNELVEGGGAAPIPGYVGCMNARGDILYGNSTANYFGENLKP